MNSARPMKNVSSPEQSVMPIFASALTMGLQGLSPQQLADLNSEIEVSRGIPGIDLATQDEETLKQQVEMLLALDPAICNQTVRKELPLMPKADRPEWALSHLVSQVSSSEH